MTFLPNPRMPAAPMMTGLKPLLYSHCRNPYLVYITARPVKDLSHLSLTNPPETDAELSDVEVYITVRKKEHRLPAELLREVFKECTDSETRSYRARPSHSPWNILIFCLSTVARNLDLVPETLVDDPT
ncbi:hypothetical protein C8J56DRAFT_1048575 [Mycena floridula]|nr:hypothetical protein C8J56DRAFT_1048575 [Mycena floridula]